MNSLSHNLFIPSLLICYKGIWSKIYEFLYNLNFAYFRLEMGRNFRNIQVATKYEGLC